jgi:hypothetical protein
VRTLRYLFLTSLIYAALTAALTYPQALHLTDTVHDDGDPLLNAWAIAWVAHQLPIAPAHIFDANIFYPERRTLAFSETLLLPAAVAAPLRWIGFGPLLVYNLVFLSGFVLSGAGVALLVRSLTGDGVAGFAGGIVFAFLPYRIDHYPHLQLQQTQCLPFAFWAFHRLMRSGSVRDGLLFGALTAGQILSCMYYGLFLVPYMAVVCGVLVVGARLSKAHLVALAAGGAIAVLAVAPVGRAYLGARAVVGERSAEEAANGSATPLNYLGPPEFNLVYGEWLKPFAAGERRLFPGFVAMTLSVVALFTAFITKPSAFALSDAHGASARSASALNSAQDASARRGTRAVLAYAAGLVIAFDLSLGFNGISYRLLYEFVLPFRGLRVPARMGVMTGFSLAVLSGFGIHALMAAAPSRARARWIAGAAAALMLVEYASKPLDLRQIPTEPPASYADVVADRGDNPTTTLFEFPASPLDDPSYMYYSTFHWQYLVNGYSGFFPPSYNVVLNAVKEFPDQRSFDAIKARGARYLLVHGERLFGARYEELGVALAERKDLTLISRRPAVGPNGHGEISLYRISYADVP